MKIRRMLTRIMLALLSVAVRTMRHVSPHQVSGSSSAGLPANGLSLPVLAAPGRLFGSCSSFAIWSGTLTSSAYAKVDHGRLCSTCFTPVSKLR